MDEQTDQPSPAQNIPQQNQQPSNSAPQTAGTNPNPQQQVPVEPVKKKMAWWIWVIIALGVIVVLASIYYFFFR